MSNIAFLFLPLAFFSLPAVLPFVSPSSQVCFSTAVSRDMDTPRIQEKKCYSPLDFVLPANVLLKPVGLSVSVFFNVTELRCFRSNRGFEHSVVSPRFELFVTAVLRNLNECVVTVLFGLCNCCVE